MSISDVRNTIHSVPRILFVHANPLVEGLASLDYLEEENIIIKCCREARVGVRFQSQVGTVKGFSSSLIYGADIIHYSGHGDRNSIVLEKDNGDIHYLDSKSLESLLHASETGCICTIAFVSACHSEEAGRKFVAAGVKHVVCVKQNEMVSDSSSLTFAKLFYSALFQGKTVKSAFDIALSTVIADESSHRPVLGHINPIANHQPVNQHGNIHHPQPTAVSNHNTISAKYVLLPTDSAHDEVLFTPQYSPENSLPSIFVDETKRDCTNHCDRPPSKFVSRNHEMQLAYSYLCSARPRSRLVSIEGERGVGKTAFICQLAQYIAERNAYDQICFIPCSRMQRHYETSTHGNYSLQMEYLVHQFARSLNRHQDDEIFNLEDLISRLEGRGIGFSSSSSSVYRLSGSGLGLRGQSIDGDRRLSSEVLDYLSTASSDEYIRKNSQLYDSPFASNKGVNYSYEASSGGILYIIDGCDDFLRPSSTDIMHSTLAEGRSSDLTLSPSSSSSSSVDDLESEKSGATHFDEPNLSSYNEEGLTPLLNIIDSILRRTANVNFLLTRGKSAINKPMDSLKDWSSYTDEVSANPIHERTPSIAHIIEPEKIITLKPFNNMKMAELVRKVAPRPFSLTELGLTPATIGQANEMLMKCDWLQELLGNPRAAIFFVRYLADISLSDHEQCLKFAKKCYQEAISHRYASNPIAMHDHSTAYGSISSTRSKRGLSSSISNSSYSNVTESWRHSLKFHPTGHDLVSNHVHDPNDGLIRSQSWSVISANKHHSLKLVGSQYEDDPVHKLNSSNHYMMPMNNSISTGSDAKAWVDKLAEALFASLFTSEEKERQMISNPELRSRLSRQYSDSDRLYLYSVFISRAAVAMKGATPSNRLSNSSLSSNQATNIRQASYIAAQDLYKLWWDALCNTLRKFRYEFMCWYPIILYGFCNRQRAEQLLVEENKSGLFLLRFSESKTDGSIVITSLLRHEDKIEENTSLSTYSSFRSDVHGISNGGSSRNLQNEDNSGSMRGSMGISNGHNDHDVQSHRMKDSHLRIYHHLLQVNDFGLSLSFRDHRSTYSSLKCLLEGCDSLKILYPDVSKADLIKHIDDITMR